MKGLPAIETTQITLEKGFAQSNYKDLAQFIPAIQNIKNQTLLL